MFESLPTYFREHDLHTDVRTLLVLHKAIQRGLVKTLGDIYNVLKGLVVKDPSQLGPFTRAFYEYFLEINIRNGERLNDAILRSKTFREWRDQFLQKEDVEQEPDLDELVNRFLDDVHLTSYDIKEIISGKDIYDNDDPFLKDEFSDETEEETQARKKLEKMADYSNLSLEELMERMEQIAKEQKSKHRGGSHWIGTEGISPYGHGGAAKNGIRVGGSGGGKMARKVLNDRKFFPIDVNALINDNNVDAALAALKGIEEESAEDILDVNATIDLGLKRGGLFIPELTNVQHKKLQVILLIDNGGYSMDPYIRTVRELFKKMKTRFAHDLETYYFHNTIYKRVFSDPQRRKALPIERLLSKDPNYRIFIIGDASMAPYELDRTSVNTYLELKKKFKKLTWLNPEPQKYWHYSYTISLIKEVINMHPLTPKGIEEAVREMNRAQ